jgi:methylmalonyl-CoA mutase
MSDKFEDQKLFSDFTPVSTTEWQDLILKDLKGEDYNKKLIWHTVDGFDIQPYYRKEHIAKLKYLQKLPYEFPLIKGEEKNKWKIRQDITVYKIDRANKDAINAINNGADYIGFLMSRVPPASVIKNLLKDIDLNNILINFSNSDCFKDLIDFLVDALSEMKFSHKNFKGSMDIEPFANMMLGGSLPDTIEAITEKLFIIQSTLIKGLPSFKGINVRAHIYHNSGASTLQELAFALAQANEYLVRMTDKGMDIDTIASRLQMTFATGSNYFIEIAKIRAAKILFAKMLDYYSPKEEKTKNLTIHSVSSKWNKSIYDPYTNVLRNATETMSAIIGGADSITVDPFDGIFKLPDDFSIRIARNIQNLLKHESFLDKVIDPAAGSYYVENITDILVEKAWALFKEVEKRGGFYKSAMSGFIQDEINLIVEQRMNMIISRKENILGASIYPDFNEKILDNVELDVFEEQKPTGNLVKPLIKWRKAEPFEKLRLRTEKHIANKGKQPKVFLLQIGNPGMSTARAIFSGNFFGTAGYQIISHRIFKHAEDGVKTAIKAKANIVVICSSDEEYNDFGTQIGKQIKENNANIKVVIAGYPKEIIDHLKASGVDDFIHIKSNVLETLDKFHSYFGIKNL